MEPEGVVLVPNQRCFKEQEFLNNFAQILELKAAAVATGIDRHTVYTWLKGSEEFARAFEGAKTGIRPAGKNRLRGFLKGRRCPRCKGNLYIEKNEISCLQCGYVEYQFEGDFFSPQELFELLQKKRRTQ